MSDSLEKRFMQPDGWQWGTIINAGGHTLRYGGLPAQGRPLANVVYAEGMGEFAETTFELAREFNRQACGFWVLDRYGQGMSGRYLSDRFKLHAGSFDNDVFDLLEMVDGKVPDNAPVFLFGHSTGGLLATQALHDDPEMFAGGILTCPLFGIQNPAVKNREHLFARAPFPAWLRTSYIPGGGPWRSREERGTIDKHSSDPVRKKVPDYWTRNVEDIRIGDVTWEWVKQASRAITKVGNPDYLEEIEKPLLIFTAGRDHLVNNEAAFRALAHLKDVEFHHFADGKHSLPLETDDIRNSILQQTFAFIKKHAPSGP